jgi:hypothetical protein
MAATSDNAAPSPYVSMSLAICRTVAFSVASNGSHPKAV